MGGVFALRALLNIAQLIWWSKLPDASHALYGLSQLVASSRGGVQALVLLVGVLLSARLPDPRLQSTTTIICDICCKPDRALLGQQPFHTQLTIAPQCRPNAHTVAADQWGIIRRAVVSLHTLILHNHAHRCTTSLYDAGHFTSVPLPAGRHFIVTANLAVLKVSASCSWCENKVGRNAPYACAGGNVSITTGWRRCCWWAAQLRNGAGLQQTAQTSTAGQNTLGECLCFSCDGIGHI